MPDPDMVPPCILCVFAHPDDEQWGTAGALALCVERGIDIHVLSATSGDKGEISDPALATPDNFGAVREEELRTACALLGFQPPILLRYGDGTLAQADPDTLIRQVVTEMRRLRPDVVITFDANGGYGHLDHIAIHQATRAAFDLAPQAEYETPGLPAHRVAKLYATAYLRSSLPRLEAELERQGLPPIDFGPVQTVFGDELMTPDEVVTTVVPVDSVFERRWASLRAHRTQFGDASPFIAVGVDVARSWMSHDNFRRIHPAPAAGATLPDEDDLWAGLPLPVRTN